MKQIIKNSPPSDTITFKDAIDTLNCGSIIVQITRNKLTFLSSDSTFGDILNRCGFRRIQVYPDYNTCSPNATEVLTRAVITEPSMSGKIYLFGSLQDLAKAIVANGWE